MANVIIRRIFLSGSFQPLMPKRMVGSFTFIVAESASSVELQTDDGQDEVPIGRGESFSLERVNLQDIRARGELGDYIIVIGATAK